MKINIFCAIFDVVVAKLVVFDVEVVLVITFFALRRHRSVIARQVPSKNIMTLEYNVKYVKK